MKSIMKSTNVVLVFMSLFFIQFNSSAQSNFSSGNSSNKMNVVSFSVLSKSAKLHKGFWTATVENENLCLQLLDSKTDKPSYLIINCFIKSDFKTVANESNTYELKRLAGTLRFEGDLFKNGDSGTFTFERQKEFVSFLENEGVDTSDELYYFKLFLGDIAKEYITSLKELGYQPTIREIGRLAFHDASIDYIHEMSKLFPRGIELDMISKLATHNVSTSYVKSLKAVGYGDIEPEFIKQFAHHKVSANYIKSLHDLGFVDLNPSMIKRAKVHDVTVAFIENAKSRGNDFDELNEYIRFKNRKR